MKKNKKWVLSLIMIMGLVLSGCQASVVKDENVFQGMIEANDVDINSKIAGRLLTVDVEEGQTIEVNGIVASIDAKDLEAKKEGLVAVSKAALAGVEAAKAQHEAAEGQLAAAQATLNKAQNGARSEDIAKAQAAYDVTKKGYDRVKALYESDAVPLSQLDTVEAQLEVATQDLKMANEGARQEDIDAARGQVSAYQGQVAAAQMNIAASEQQYAQALAGIDEIDTYLVDSSIKSPLAGIVTSVNASAGEMVSTGMNIATITDMNDMWITLNVDETKLGKFNEGQTVKVTTVTYPDQTFDGVVTQISQKPDFAIKKASNENGEFDLMSYEVKVKIDNNEGLFRPGMTAFVNVSK